VDNKFKWISVPQRDSGNDKRNFDHSIVSYVGGDPTKPIVGREALEFDDDYLVQNIKPVMKYSNVFRANPSWWVRDNTNFIYNDEMDLEKFKPDLPGKAYKDLVEELIVKQFNSFSSARKMKSGTTKQIDVLVGIPAFPSNVQEDQNLSKKAFKNNYMRNINKIFRDLNFGKKIHFFYEPFAIIQLARHDELMKMKKDKNHILILDFGGSTFNSCVVTTTHEGKIPKANKFKNVFGTNVVNFGCSQFDQAIYAKLSSMTEPGSLQTRMSAKDALAIERFKKKVSREMMTGVIGPWDLSIPSNKQKLYQISKSLLKEVFTEHLWEAKRGIKAVISKTISDAQNELKGGIEQFDYIVFAGGGSNVPLLRELFHENFKSYYEDEDALVSIKEPESAVARGLAIECSHRLSKNTEEILSDDENVESDLALSLFNKGNELEFSSKCRLIQDAKLMSNGLLFEQESLLKQDIIENSKDEEDQKPWELRFDPIIDGVKRYRYELFPSQDKNEESRLDRHTFYFPKKVSQKHYTEGRLLLKVAEDGSAIPTLKLDEYTSTGKKFDLWSFSTEADSMLAVDIGNSTTSLFFVSADQETVKDSDVSETILQPIQETIPDDDFQKPKEPVLVEEVNDWSSTEAKCFSILECIPVFAVKSGDVSEWVKRWANSGLYYSEEIVKKLIFTLQKGKIPVLYGPPGTGKSKIIKLVSKELQAYFSLIPVEPNWTDSSFLHGRKQQEFSKAVYASNYLERIRPEKVPSTIICLDEMNMSYPEQYFAELLSRLEYEVTQDERCLEIESETLRLNSNLFITGTLNIDHTTMILSPKLKNRVVFIKNGYDRGTFLNIINHGMENSILEDQEYKRFCTLLVDANDTICDLNMLISFRNARFYNEVISGIKDDNILLDNVYDYLLTTTVIPTLEFNRINPEHSEALKKLEATIGQEEHYQKSFPAFMEAFKRIISINNGLFTSGMQ